MPLPNGGCSADQDHERGLKGIFRRMRIDQDFPTDAEHQPAVAVNQKVEGLFITLIDKARATS